MFHASLLGCDGLLEISVILWLIDASPQSLSISVPHVLPMDVSLSKFPLSIRIPVILDYSSCCLVAKSCPTFGTVTHQAPLSMGFLKQEYWSGLPFYFPGDLPNPGIKPTFLVSSALAGGFFTTSATWEGPYRIRALPKDFGLPLWFSW